jgi:hypothetical protein
MTAIRLAWNTYAGGSAVKPDKHGYDVHTDFGQFTIDPSSRGCGYVARWANTSGKSFKGQHSGLWHELGIYRSPGEAKTAVKRFIGGLEVDTSSQEVFERLTRERETGTGAFAPDLPPGTTRG